MLAVQDERVARLRCVTMRLPLKSRGCWRTHAATLACMLA